MFEAVTVVDGVFVGVDVRVDVVDSVDSYGTSLLVKRRRLPISKWVVKSRAAAAHKVAPQTAIREFNSIV